MVWEKQKAPCSALQPWIYCLARKPMDHMSRICQHASSLAKNVEPKLLGKPRLMSEFPHSESRRKLGGHNNEIQPSWGCQG